MHYFHYVNYLLYHSLQPYHLVTAPYILALMSALRYSSLLYVKVKAIVKRALRIEPGPAFQAQACTRIVWEIQ